MTEHLWLWSSLGQILVFLLLLYFLEAHLQYFPESAGAPTDPAVLERTDAISALPARFTVFVSPGSRLASAD